MMDGWRRSGRLPLIVAVLAVQGCYTHSVVPVDRVAPGESVRARVSATEADRLEQILGRESRLIRGEVVAQSADGVMLEVGTAAAPGQRLAQRVTVPHSGVLEMEIRELDRTRTFGLLGVVTVLGGVAAYSLFDGAATGNGGAPRPGGNETRIGIGFGWSF